VFLWTDLHVAKGQLVAFDAICVQIVHTYYGMFWGNVLILVIEACLFRLDVSLSIVLAQLSLTACRVVAIKTNKQNKQIVGWGLGIKIFAWLCGWVTKICVTH